MSKVNKQLHNYQNRYTTTIAPHCKSCKDCLGTVTVGEDIADLDPNTNGEVLTPIEGDVYIGTDGSTWFYDCMSGTWVIGSDSSEGENIYNTSDSLTDNRVLEGAGFNLTFQNIVFFLAQASSQVRVISAAALLNAGLSSTFGNTAALYADDGIATNAFAVTASLTSNSITFSGRLGAVPYSYAFPSYNGNLGDALINDGAGGVAWAAGGSLHPWVLNANGMHPAALTDSIGIGINLPTDDLHVYRLAENAGVKIQSDFTTGYAWNSLINDVGSSFYFINYGSTAVGTQFSTAKAGKQYLIANSDLLMGTFTSNTVSLATNNVVRAVLGTVGELQLIRYGNHLVTGTPNTYGAWDTSGNLIERSVAEMQTDLGIGGLGLWSTNANGIHVTDTTDFVGIGTNLPASFLEARKDADATTEFRFKNAGSGAGTSARTLHAIYGDAANGLVTYVQNSAFTTSGIFTAGSVVQSMTGIWNGDYSLGVAGTGSFNIFTGVTSTANIRLTILDTGETGFGLINPTARVHIKSAGSTSATDAFIIENSIGTDIFHIEDSGDVGINNSNPTVALDVTGSMRLYDPIGTPTYSFQNDIQAWNTYRVNGSADLFYKSVGTNGSLRLRDSANVDVFTANTSTGEIIFGKYLTGTFNTAATDILGTSATGQVVQVAFGGGDLGLWSTDTNGIIPTTLANNVGIGTASSATIKLTVATSTDVYAISGTNSGTTGTNIGVLGTTGAASTGTSYGVQGQATGAALVNVGGLFTATGGTTNYGLLVTNGNVGIGTSTPNESLQLNGSGSNVFLQLTNASNGITASDGALIGQVGINLGIINQETGGDIYIQVEGTEVARITPNEFETHNGIAHTGAVTDSSTGTQNDYAPTSAAIFAKNYWFTLTAASALTITGLDATNAQHGTEKAFFINTTQTVTFTSGDVLSASTNRILAPDNADIIPSVNSVVVFSYHASEAKWILKSQT